MTITIQVDPATVSSDSFMVNIQTVLLRFAEPFMDATYSKVRHQTQFNIERAFPEKSDKDGPNRSLILCSVFKN